MPTVFLDGLSFSGLARMFIFLLRKDTEIRIWHDRPFVTTLKRPAHGLTGQ